MNEVDKIKKHKPRFRGKYVDRFIEIPESEVPPKIVWNRAGGPTTTHVFYSLGKNYKKAVDTRSGKTWYYKLRDGAEPPIRHGMSPRPTPTAPPTPASVIDAEPEKKPRKRYKTGTKLWFVDTTGAWFLCEVISWSKRPSIRMLIRPVTGRDSERRVDWPYGGDLEFPGKPGNRIYDRLRPLADKAP